MELLGFKLEFWIWKFEFKRFPRAGIKRSACSSSSFYPSALTYRDPPCYSWALTLLHCMATPRARDYRIIMEHCKQGWRYVLLFDCLLGLTRRLTMEHEVNQWACVCLCLGGLAHASLDINKYLWQVQSMQRGHTGPKHYQHPSMDQDPTMRAIRVKPACLQHET